MVKFIETNKGEKVYVSEEDYDKVNCFKWYVNRMGYACNDSKPRKTMHRFLLDYPKYNIDHKDGNKLNNTRDNLRPCNQSQNTANGKIRETNKSGYKGVSWNKKYSKWEAYITKNYKHIFLGYFEDIKEAAKAYNKSAMINFEEFSRVNKI